jgi:hypothetical protein
MVFKYREAVRVAKFMRDYTDEAAERITPIDQIVVTDVDSVAQPTMGHTATTWDSQTFT